MIGSYGEKKSPVVTQTPMFYYHIKLNAGNLFTLPVNTLHSAALYILKGKIKVLNEETKTGELIHFNEDGDQVIFFCC